MLVIGWGWRTTPPRDQEKVQLGLLVLMPGVMDPGRRHNPGLLLQLADERVLDRLISLDMSARNVSAVREPLLWRAKSQEDTSIFHEGGPGERVPLTGSPYGSPYCSAARAWATLAA
jgi:hypothetical protein